MKKVTTLLSLTLLAGMTIAAFGNPFPFANAEALLPAPSDQAGQTGGVMFVENRGQFDARARFRAQVGSGVLWLAEDALWLTVAESPSLDEPGSVPAELGARRAVNLRLSFSNANPAPRLEPFARQETVLHYYRGSDPAQWQTNVPVWGGVRYVDLYPGVDLEVSSANGQWNWRLIYRTNRQPASDLARLRIEGSDGVDVGRAFIQVQTGLGDVFLPLLAVTGAPALTLPAVARVTDSVFEISSPFSTKAAAESELAQVDYPEESYFGTLLGGSDFEEAYSIAVGGTGDIIDSSRQRAVYVTGFTMSSDFPTEPGDTSLSGPADVFVTRLQRVATLVRPAFSAYIGGAEDDEGYDIALDQDGNVYVTGWTASGDFPTTPNALDQTHNSCSDCEECYSQADAFVVKMDNAGGLAYATYLGGSYYSVPGMGKLCGTDSGAALAVDAQGMVYVTGKTRSQDFPTTPGAYDTVFSNPEIGLNEDTFVVKLDLTGGVNGLLYGSFVGGGTPSRGQDMVIDGDGQLYVVGVSESDPLGRHYFPTTSGAYSVGTGRGTRNEVIIFKMDPAGNGSADLLYSTFLGTQDSDAGEGIAIDADNQVYVVGTTASPDFPTTPGALDTSCGTDGNCNSRNDLFVSKLNLGGNGSADLVYSTFLGGNYFENFMGKSDIELGSDGDVYVSGDTGSDEGFPITSDAYDTVPDSTNLDVFVTRLRLDGQGANDLVYGTYVGNFSREFVAAMTLDEKDRVYVAGNARPGYGNPPVDFPTTQRAFSRYFSGEQDAFVFRLLAPPPTPDLSASTKTVSANNAALGQVVTFTVQLVNSGELEATVAFTDTLPPALLLQGSPTASAGDAPGVQGQTITWSGTVTEAASVEIRYAALLTSISGTGTATAVLPIVNEALISDGLGNVYTRRAFVNAYRIFVPLVLK